jgi:sec-independent protein translocase protein TatB
MFGIGTGELLVILVIAVLVVGPERMVQFASQLGKWLAQFRQTTDSVTKDFREAFSLEAGEEAPEGADAQAAQPGQQETSGTPSSETAPQTVVSPAETPGPLAPETASVAALLDGEAKPDGEPPVGEAGGDSEPVAVEVAQLVPEDKDVEPVAVEQAVLVTESVDDATSDGEG